jgi:hypothetical protein
MEMEPEIETAAVELANLDRAYLSTWAKQKAGERSSLLFLRLFGR